MIRNNSVTARVLFFVWNDDTSYCWKCAFNHALHVKYMKQTGYLSRIESKKTLSSMLRVSSILMVAHHVLIENFEVQLCSCNV